MDNMVDMIVLTVMKKRIRSREIILRSLKVWEQTQKELKNQMK